MNDRALWCAPLAALFASLLSACQEPGGCGLINHRSFFLTAEEYAQWAQKGQAPGTTGAPTSGGSDSEQSTDPTGGSSTGESTTGGSSTGDSTTGSSTTTTGATATGDGSSPEGDDGPSQQEVCSAVCASRVGAYQSCSVTEADEQPELAALGLPPPRAATRLCAGLDAALWS